MATVRAVAIAVLIAACWVVLLMVALEASRRIDDRFRETRFVVRTGGCPIAIYQQQGWPDCPIGQPSYDGT